ncbi:heparinase II/III domain-containing protein [Pseudomonas sp. OTU750018]|uniref:heparinase II/III domain-containing protein n=1 Tax=Pseudomonas sp. OTU750018 TaxID=2709708 RepID=UPI001420F5F8|nr:heparinase II/III family protein [Pseudomonas sp. OTU750018]
MEALLGLLGRIKKIRFLLWVVLVFRLRPINIIRVLVYRRRLEKGYFIRALPCVSNYYVGDFWIGAVDRLVIPSVSTDLRQVMLARGDEIVAGLFRRFEDEVVFEGEQPQWHKSGYFHSRGHHFSTIALNVIPGDDVKLCWDLSRFKWLTQLVIAAVHAPSANDADRYLARAHSLLKQWLENNAYFSGVNWACGQEVSIRGLHLMNSLLLLEKHFQARPGKTSIDFLTSSYRRVEETISYSLSQENNHSLTESLFLYYVPLFLARYGVLLSARDSAETRYKRFSAIFSRLIQKDGSFRMYSVNYHRAVCDILSLAKVLDDELNIGFWTAERVVRIGNMHEFLSAVIVSEAGGAPVIGHNDGSLHAIQYASSLLYTPSLLFMGGVFSLPVSIEFSDAQRYVYCFGRVLRFIEKVSDSYVSFFEDFGLVVVRRPGYQAFFKYARNKGRPQQQDFLHFDLWVNGKNILHDSGTYSYNPKDIALVDYFDDSTAHNGPFLIGQAFVKRLSRFLYLEWPNAQVVETIDEFKVEITACLNNSSGLTFIRNIQFFKGRIAITDSGPQGVDWGVSFNVPSVLKVLDSAAPLALAPGVSLTCDQPLVVESAHYSQRYLEQLAGARIIACGTEVGVTTHIRIQDLP